MPFKTVLGDLVWKNFLVPNQGGQHLISVLQLSSLKKITNYSWKVKSNPILSPKIETIQYNAAFPITGAIKGTSERSSKGNESLKCFTMN